MKEIFISTKLIGEGYMVSTHGRVFSLHRMRFLKYRLCEKGYPRVALKIDGKNKHIRIHRIVASAFLPNPENKTQVNHKDGNKENNHYSNLEWVTARENILHSIENRMAHTTRAKSGRYCKDQK